MPAAPLVAGWRATHAGRWDSRRSTEAVAAGPVPAVVTTPAPPAFPTAAILGLLVELYLAGAWVDITSYVYERDSIVITRGRPNEGSQVEPTDVGLTLNNRDGRYSDRNPAGPYYGLIGRNTPLRVTATPALTAGPAPDVADTFTRVVTDTNWGISESGPPWAAYGTDTAPANYAVTGTAAAIYIAANSKTTGCRLAGCSWTDFDASVTVTIPVATGGSLTAAVVTHVAADGSSAGPLVRMDCDVTNTVRLRALDASGTQIGSTYSTGYTHTGAPWRLRVRTAGRMLFAKVWDPAGAEPAGWQLAVEDTVAYDPGGVAVYTGALGGNTNVKPVTVTFGDFTLTAHEPRATVEVTAWPARWSPGSQDVWVPVESAGILRRLGQGTPPANSAPVRYVLAQASPPAAYWPCEDGEQATSCAALVGGDDAIITAAAGSTVAAYLGKGDLGGWTPSVLAPNDTMQLYCHVVQTPGLTHWAVDWVRRGEESATGSTMIIRTASRQWEVQFNPDVPEIRVKQPDASTVAAAAGTFYDGDTHHVRFDIVDNAGATLDWTVYVDGISWGGSSYTLPVGSDPTEGVMYVKFKDLANHTTDLALGHIVVWDAVIPSVVPAAAAALGHVGETAGARIVRLCAEEGIALRIVGGPNTDLTGTAPMQQQRAAGVLALLRAAEDADGGVLYEPRDFVGLAYRHRAGMHNQTPALTLDYDAGHIAPGLEPTPDDAEIRNDVTVTRQDGQTYRAELTSGTMSTAAPPAGVGRYDSQETLEVQADTDLPDQAWWRVHLGTVNEPRYPTVPLDLAHLGSIGEQAVIGEVARLDTGDRFTVAHPPQPQVAVGPIDQMLQGYTERLGPYLWTVAANCSPASPWAIATVESGDEFCFRLDTDASTLAADAAADATSLSVASAGIVWTTSAAYPHDFPFDVNIAGVRITVTAIAGATSPQTFTVVRSVDGFDVALATGAAVRLWRPVYLGLG